MFLVKDCEKVRKLCCNWTCQAQQ